jgi:hypothetical protein
VNNLARGADIEQSHDVIIHERLRVGMSWLAQNFDFVRGDTLVRLIAAIFLIPHIYSKRRFKSEVQQCNMDGMAA